MISGTVLKYLLAEFNSSEPEVYSHHKAVRDLIADETMRDYSLVDMDNASCDCVLDNPKDDQVNPAKLFYSFSYQRTLTKFCTIDFFELDGIVLYCGKKM